MRKTFYYASRHRARFGVTKIMLAVLTAFGVATIVAHIVISLVYPTA